MTWLKIDDGFAQHPKIEELSDGAFRLHVAAMAYAARNLTDGFIPSRTALRLTHTAKPKHLKELTEVGLWDQGGDDGWMIHDYLLYNPSRAHVEAERQWGAQRQAMHRDPVLRSEIKARDGDQCRYCARTVKWTDRKSPLGGTYDHVIPRGPNTAENLVVACRGCNSAKRDRTPEQAGMPLLDPPVTRSDLDPDLDRELESNKKTRPVPSSPFDPSVKDFSRVVDEPVDKEVVVGSLAAARSSLHSLPRRAG